MFENHRLHLGQLRLASCVLFSRYFLESSAQTNPLVVLEAIAAHHYELIFRPLSSFIRSFLTQFPNRLLLGCDLQLFIKGDSIPHLFNLLAKALTLQVYRPCLSDVPLHQCYYLFLTST